MARWTRDERNVLKDCAIIGHEQAEARGDEAAMRLYKSIGEKLGMDTSGWA